MSDIKRIDIAPSFLVSTTKICPINVDQTTRNNAFDKETFWHITISIIDV